MDFKKYFYESATLLEDFIDTYEQHLNVITQMVINALETGNTIFHVGNGGSAADAQHFDAELVGTFYNKQRKWLRSEALTTNSSTLTAVGNDLWFDFIFSRQLEAKAKTWDLLFVFSTSGNSKNCILAVQKAKELWVTTIGLLGKDWGLLKDICDHLLIVPSENTPQIQQIHEAIFHAICEKVDAYFS